MNFPPTVWHRFHVLLLPALLLAGSTLGVGAYYETSDDPLLTALLRGGGLMTPAPTTDLRPFLPGLSWGLAHLYRSWPDVPWYGLTLALGLYGALALCFRLLCQAAPATWSGWPRTGLLAAFFALAFFDHAFCYNFTRPAILLAAAATGNLLATPRLRPVMLLCVVVALLLALALRFDGAVFGTLLAAIGSGAWRHAGSHAASGSPRSTAWVVARLGSVGLLMAAFWLLDYSTQSPARRVVVQLNRVQGQIHDYRTFFVRTLPSPADSLRAEMAGCAMTGATCDITPAFYARIGGTDWQHFFGQRALTRISRQLDHMVRIYGAWLLLAGALAVLSWGRVPTHWLLLPIAATLLLLLLTGTWLKLPDRVAISAFTVLLASQFGHWLQSYQAVVVPKRRRRIFFLASLTLAVCCYGFTVQQRLAQVRNNRNLYEARWARVAAHYPAGSWLITRPNPLMLGAPVFSLAARPPYRILPLTGWHLIDPSYAAQWHHLTGEREWAAAMQRLTAAPNAVWLVPAARVALLRAYLHHAYGLTLPPVRLHPELEPAR